MCKNPAPTSGEASIVEDSVTVRKLIEVILPGSYPKKDLSLQDIAEVRYVPLETSDESLFKNIRWVAMRDDKIVITDFSKQVLVFDSAGRFISKIAREGPGPQEYRIMANTAVDFDRQLVYVEDIMSIIAYDFDGYLIRRFPKPDYVSADMLYVCGPDRLIAYYETNGLKEEGDTLLGNYFYIDLPSGKRTNVGIVIPHPASNTRMEIHDGLSISSCLQINTMLKTDGKVIISDYVYPSVFAVSDSCLNRIIEREVSDDAQWLTSAYLISDPCIMFRAIRSSNDKGMFDSSRIELRDFIYDCATQEIYEGNLYNRDMNISGASFIEGWGYDLPKNTIVEAIRSEFLMDLNKKGKLSGPLKALADTLDADSNDILMIATLKQ